LPNEQCRFLDSGERRPPPNPRYILDLMARIVTVSLATMQIVDLLPPLSVREPQNEARS